MAGNGGEASFTITHTPDALGAFDFDLDVLSDDGDESPYDITVSGTGTDGEAPTFVITGVPAITTGTSPFTATFTFSEAVTGFDAAADITASYATIGTITACHQQYIQPK